MAPTATCERPGNTTDKKRGKEIEKQTERGCEKGIERKKEKLREINISNKG
jgi:hypothetical protein